MNAERSLSARALTVLAVVVATIVAPIGAVWAGAAELSGVFRVVTTTPTNPTNSDPIRTTVSWCVPNTATAGDTFTLTLPPQLVGGPSSVTLRDPAGAVVATAAISSTIPPVVTFTLTDYAQTHRNICGSAWFESGLASHVAPGSTQELVYRTSDGTTFTNVITVQPPFVVDRRGPDKWGAFSVPADQCRTNGTDCLIWTITTPAGPFEAAVVSDTAMAGTTFDCPTLQVELYTVGADGHLVDPQPYTGSVDIDCSPASFTVTLGPAAEGKVIQVRVKTNVLADNAGGVTYQNTATVTLTVNGYEKTFTRNGSLRSGSAGGEGSGDNISIRKDDAAGHAGDTASDPVVLPEGTTRLAYTITNTGATALHDVVVSDVVVSNGTVTGLSCDFSPLGGPATGTRWAGPFPVGASFTCTATLSGVQPGSVHQDIARVTGIGASGQPVTAENPYHAITPRPQIEIVKGDSSGNAADTVDTRVTLPDGSTGLVFTVTNTGTEPLRTVVVSDVVVSGGTVTGLSCDFSGLGGPATGTSWAGPMPVGASFPCTATLSGVAEGAAHQDVASVTGVGTLSGRTVSDDNPYYATRPEVAAPTTTPTTPVIAVPTQPTTLPATGAPARSWALVAGTLMGLGGLLMVAGRRRRQVD